MGGAAHFSDWLVGLQIIGVEGDGSAALVVGLLFHFRAGNHCDGQASQQGQDLDGEEAVGGADFDLIEVMHYN